MSARSTELQRSGIGTRSTAARVNALRGDMHNLSAIIELQEVQVAGVLFAWSTTFSRA
jgi:hypothetical protein